MNKIYNKIFILKFIYRKKKLYIKNFINKLQFSMKTMDYLELSKYEIRFNIKEIVSKDRIFVKNLTNKRIAFKVIDILY